MLYAMFVIQLFAAESPERVTRSAGTVFLCASNADRLPSTLEESSPNCRKKRKPKCRPNRLIEQTDPVTVLLFERMRALNNAMLRKQIISTDPASAQLFTMMHTLNNEMHRALMRLYRVCIAEPNEAISQNTQETSLLKGLKPTSDKGLYELISRRMVRVRNNCAGWIQVSAAIKRRQNGAVPILEEALSRLYEFGNWKNRRAEELYAVAIRKMSSNTQLAKTLLIQAAGLGNELAAEILERFSAWFDRGKIIPPIAKGHEEAYLKFIGGEFVYKKGQPDEVRLKIADLENPLDGSVDLSKCGDSSKFLDIGTGPHRAENKAGTRILEFRVVPRFLCKTGKPNNPFVAIPWPVDHPFILVWRMNHCNVPYEHSSFKYRSFEEAPPNDLYALWERPSQRMGLGSIMCHTSAKDFSFELGRI